MLLLKKYGIVLLLTGATLLAFGTCLRYGFSQDDFIHLWASRASSVDQFLNFYNPFHQFDAIFFYRPLTTQTYFFINSSLFGLHSIPFHIEALLLHVVASYIVYLLIKKIWGSTSIATLSSVLYAGSAVHFLNFYYISAFQQIGRAFFMLLSIYTFVLFYESQKKKYFYISLGSFFAALLSKETAVVTPFLLICVMWLIAYKMPIIVLVKQLIKPISPFFIVLFVYGLFRYFGFQSIFSQGEYQASFTLSNFVQNLKWYSIWTLGLPELLMHYPSLGPSAWGQFFKDYNESKVILPALSVVALLVIGLLSKVKLLPIKRISALGMLFFLPLLPVLFLSEHRYPQYLDISLVAVLPVFVWLLLQSGKYSKYLITLGISAFIVVQFFSLRLSEKTHWTTKRAITAAHYYEILKPVLATTNPGTNIQFIGTDADLQELAVTLGYHRAVIIWFGDTIVDVQYRSNPDFRDNTVIIPITK